MLETGVRTTDFDSSALFDELLGNKDGSTIRVSRADAATALYAEASFLEGVTAVSTAAAAASAAAAATQATTATAQAVSAAASATAAELAVLAAGAPIVTTLPTPIPANGSIRLLKVDAGLQVFEVVSAAWVLRGWLVGPSFDTVSLLLASTATTLGPTGQYVQAGIYRYLVAAADAPASNDLLTTAGGIKVRVLPTANGYDCLAWGVEVNNAASTARMQQAIDFILDTGLEELLAPAGHYVFTKLRLFQTSGGARKQRGKMSVRGQGRLGITETFRGTRVNPFYGTIIEITNPTASEDGLILASGNGLQRQIELENLSIIYNGTGYAIDARYIPEVKLRDVAVRITHAQGKVANVQDAWGAIFERCICAVDMDVVSTVAGFRYSATLFAGNLIFRDCVIDHFNDNVWLDGGTNFTNLVLQNTWLQKFRRHALLCQSPIWNLTLQDFYSETEAGLGTTAANTGLAASNHIKIDPASGSVVNFNVNGWYILAGDQTKSFHDDAIIDLRNCNQAVLNNVKVFRPWTPLVNLRSDCRLTIDGVDVQHDAVANLPTGPLSMITAASGFFPRVELNRSTMSASSKLRWFDPALVAVSQNDGHGAHLRSAFSLGLKPVTIGTGAAYTWSTEQARPLAIAVSATGGAAGTAPVAVRLLPASTLREGEQYIVINLPTSTQNALIRNDQNNTNIATVQPGQMAIGYADPVNNKWIVAVSNYSYGP
jgi:hypothetical protein